MTSETPTPKLRQASESRIEISEDKGLKETSFIRPNGQTVLTMSEHKDSVTEINVYYPISDKAYGINDAHFVPAAVLEFNKNKHLTRATYYSAHALFDEQKNTVVKGKNLTNQEMPLLENITDMDAYIYDVFKTVHSYYKKPDLKKNKL